MSKKCQFEFCEKSYGLQKSLENHIKNKHSGENK